MHARCSLARPSSRERPAQESASHAAVPAHRRWACRALSIPHAPHGVATPAHPAHRHPASRSGRRPSQRRCIAAPCCPPADRAAWQMHCSTSSCTAPAALPPGRSPAASEKHCPCSPASAPMRHSGGANSCRDRKSALDTKTPPSGSTSWDPGDGRTSPKMAQTPPATNDFRSTRTPHFSDPLRRNALPRHRTVRLAFQSHRMLQQPL